MLVRIASALLILAIMTPILPAQSDAADDRIYDEVRRRLANDRDVKGAGIEVTVKQGAVTLQGRVATEKARTKATTIARKVKGVKEVDNQLKLFGVD
jgi:osmotically-inducible protein OsmY